jgi:imidazolonepropionase-like amidohydrolase
MRYRKSLAVLTVTAGGMAFRAGGRIRRRRGGGHVYRNGVVYTVDAGDSVQQALAVRAGRIVYVGSDAGLTPFVGARTAVIDLKGRMLMPGLVDGHMHPLQGGAALLKCNMNYVQLSIEEMQAKDPGLLGWHARARTGCVA